ncbi:MAG: molybdopterin molybdotransferase MoeA [Firmicutes bacterium]|nr:molybdopterin molybdotransferase MoeA [Bacillota bacterium]
MAERPLHQLPRIDWMQARSLLLRDAAPLGQESVFLDDALGRVAAIDFVAPLDVPPFDRAAMDGYAVRAIDTRAATPQVPVALRVVGSEAAGQYWEGSLAPGSCLRIMTGAFLPAGSDAVVPLEETIEARVMTGAGGMEEQVIHLTHPVASGDHVGHAGEDVRKGSQLFPSGRVLTPLELAMIGHCGLASLSCFRRPRVALAATGSELVAPGSSLPPGAIYESNTVMLRTLLERAGAQVQVLGIIPDDFDRLYQQVEDVLPEIDLLVTTGGASLGDYDLGRRLLHELGLPETIARLDLKPGGAFLYGSDGRRRYAALSGNPTSAFLGAVLLLRPLIQRLGGRALAPLQRFSARWGGPQMSASGRSRMLRVALHEISADDAVQEEKGTVMVAEPAGSQASNIFSTFLRTDALLYLPFGQSVAPQDSIEVWPLHQFFER